MIFYCNALDVNSRAENIFIASTLLNQKIHRQFNSSYRKIVRDAKLNGLMPSKVQRDSRRKAIFAWILEPIFRYHLGRIQKNPGSVRRKVSFSLFCSKVFNHLFSENEKESRQTTVLKPLCTKSSVLTVIMTISDQLHAVQIDRNR